MSLADELYEAIQNPNDHPDDELGLAIWDNVDYYVARALAIQIRDRESPFTIHQLHLRDGILYYGNSIVAQNSTNFYYYTETDRKLSTGQMVLFWKKLKTCLPVLDKSIIQISDNLFWDRPRGMVIGIGEIKEKYGSGSGTSEKSDSIPEEKGVLCDEDNSRPRSP